MGMTNETESPWVKLTEREQEIAFLLATGDKSREIATALGLSIKTVDTHRTNLLKKLKVKNNVELLRFMIRGDLVKL